MDGKITIAEITEQHAPILLRTAQLVDCLRACAYLAATPQAADIILPRTGGLSPLFATALSTVANEGLDVLGKASTYFLDIQLTTSSMCSTVERLQQSFGKPEERVTHERLLKRVQDEIENCTKGSKDLKADLAAWGKKVQQFEGAVHAKQSSLNADVTKTENGVGRLNDDISNEDKRMERVLQREMEAREFHRDALKQKNSLVQTIALPQTFDPVEIGWQAARYSWCWFWSRGASQDLRDAENELEKRRQAAEEFEVQITEARVQLAQMEGKVFELREYRKGLASTLKAVVSLSLNLQSVVTEFDRMGPFVKQLVQRDKATRDLSSDYADAIALGSEIKLFADDMNQMGQWALTVEHMAWMYGGLIERVLIGGLNDLHDVSNHDDFERSLELIKLRADEPQNNSVCSLLLKDVDASYSRKEKALQMSHGRALLKADKATKAQNKMKKKSFFRR